MNNVSINYVQFSPDDQLIVSGGNDKIVKIWNSNTLELMG